MNVRVVDTLTTNRLNAVDAVTRNADRPNPYAAAEAAHMTLIRAIEEQRLANRIPHTGDPMSRAAHATTDRAYESGDRGLHWEAAAAHGVAMDKAIEDGDAFREAHHRYYVGLHTRLGAG